MFLDFSTVWIKGSLTIWKLSAVPVIYIHNYTSKLPRKFFAHFTQKASSCN